jgi:hypothetical protein
MVNNSTNINKTKTPTSHHISLNTQSGTTTYDVDNYCAGLGQAQICGGVKPLNEIPPSSLDKWITNGKAYIKHTIIKYKQIHTIKLCT